MITSQKITNETIDTWATDANGPVALHLRQLLLPVEGRGAVIFPPTYAGSRDEDAGYNIDEVAGKLVATIDSVGSQANRMEPIFAEEPYRSLVPQIEVHHGGARKVSIFEVGHRLGDALVRSTDMAEDVEKAFESFQGGDTIPLAKLAPTSLVFGVWDSRGSQAKVPRLVQSVIRAWDVHKLKRSAQYEPPIDYSKLEVFSEEEVANAEEGAKTKNARDPTAKALAEEGFVHIPSVGKPGGIVARGDIERTVTLNLVALRRLSTKDPQKTQTLRRYVLGLALVAATQPMDPFLRQGCLLTPDPEATDSWSIVHRNGKREVVELDERAALVYAQESAKAFGVGESRTMEFAKEKAKSIVAEAKKVKKKR